MWEDVPLTDADDNVADKDQPMPMSLEKSKSEIEKDQMVATFFYIEEL